MGMRKLLGLAKRFRRDEDGAAMIEYTVLLGIITAAVIATIILVGIWVNAQWVTLEGFLPS
jgi:pilus assembly protein Flp/PilA